MDNSKCAQQVLESTYVFPEGIDPVTKMLLSECSKIYFSISREEVSTYVTAEDYQYYWKRVKERISSLYNTLHYRHYIVAANSKILLALHAANISEAVRRGVSLARWGIGVTVLLKKISCGTLVTKFRAICLFEADFNHWTKLIVARKMTKKAHNKVFQMDASLIAW